MSYVCRGQNYKLCKAKKIWKKITVDWVSIKTIRCEICRLIVGTLIHSLKFLNVCVLEL